MNSWWVRGGAAGAWLLLGGQAIAASTVASAPCKLVESASLPMQTQPNGEVAVTATINGHNVELLIDTGSIFSSVTATTSEELGLHLQDLNQTLSYVNSITISKYARIDRFAVGSVSGRGWDFLILPTDLVDADVSGMLAPDVLKNFDVEFDFAAGKLKLISPNTCPLAPVYWTHIFAEVPMKVDANWHVVVPASLDGKDVAVLIDTGSVRSLMTLEAAQRLFGWDEHDPRLKQLPPEAINNGAPTPVWQFPFASLSFEGIEVINPDIILIPKDHYSRRGGEDAQVIVGMSALRQLHLYFGYQAQKLYLSPAEAH